MPRGGRRRSRGRRRRPAGTSEQQAPAQGQHGESSSKRRRRRRRGGGGSALDRMVAERKQTSVQTLPPDGTLLEEVIGQMQSEFGTPTTPQEFRLLIKVPGAETESIETEPKDPQEEPREPETPETVSPAPTSEVVETTSRGPRRRRRGRRRRPGASPRQAQDLGGEDRSQDLDEDQPVEDLGGEIGSAEDLDVESAEE